MFFCQEWGWEVFQSIEKYCRTAYGYGSLKNVNSPNSVEDRMESFFMAGECAVSVLSSRSRLTDLPFASFRPFSV